MAVTTVHRDEPKDRRGSLKLSKIRTKAPFCLSLRREQQAGKKRSARSQWGQVRAAISRPASNTEQR